MIGEETRDVASRTRGSRLVPIAAVLAIALAAYGIWTRYNTVADLGKEAEDALIPRVQLISPKPGPTQQTLALPAEIDAWYEAPIYAQVSGYVSQWFKDYGAPVKRGDVLATIETPALDAQYAAAKANLVAVNARYRLAVVTASRWSALSGTQAVSQQDVDIKRADAEAQKASVTVAEQEVAHYEALTAFKKVTAPFDGVVTDRRTNIGDYVNAAGGDSSARGQASSLFAVAQIDQMRAFVSIPQSYQYILKPELTATLTLPQAPGKAIQARFLTSANAVTPATRTVVTELQMDNADHELWPGTYATARFTFPGDPNVLILPEQALLFRAHGMQVAVVDEHDRVHLQDVVLGQNLGLNVQIVAGLKRADKVVANPSLGLLDGQAVKIVQPTAGYQAGDGQQARPPEAPPPNVGSPQ
jgi:membrane fusion protein (multidrug efflux system)